MKFKYFIGNVPQEKVAASNKAFHLILFVNSAAQCIKLILQSHSFINDTLYWHYQSMKRKYDDVGEVIIVPRIDNNREY